MMHLSGEALIGLVVQLAEELQRLRKECAESSTLIEKLRDENIKHVQVRFLTQKSMCGASAVAGGYCNCRWIHCP